jgi:hypothetical protein
MTTSIPTAQVQQVGEARWHAASALVVADACNAVLGQRSRKCVENVEPLARHILVTVERTCPVNHQDCRERPSAIRHGPSCGNSCAAGNELDFRFSHDLMTHNAANEPRAQAHRLCELGARRARSPFACQACATFNAAARGTKCSSATYSEPILAERGCIPRTSDTGRVPLIRPPKCGVLTRQPHPGPVAFIRSLRDLGALYRRLARELDRNPLSLRSQ